jgi:hypothetical protein
MPAALGWIGEEKGERSQTSVSGMSGKSKQEASRKAGWRREKAPDILSVLHSPKSFRF